MRLLSTASSNRTNSWNGSRSPPLQPASSFAANQAAPVASPAAGPAADETEQQAFDRLAPLFHQTGTSHERHHDTLTFRNNMNQRALPMRLHGSFKVGEAVGGTGIHWDDLDEDISVEGLLLGRKDRRVEG